MESKKKLDTCMRKSTDPSHLVEVSQFECDVCCKKFPTKKQLKAHSLTHSGVLMFSCDYCNYKCKTKCHLQRHMRIHAGSKPYSCPYCKYRI